MTLVVGKGRGVMVQCGDMRGRLAKNGVRLLEHEMETVEYFLARGEDVGLIVPRNKSGKKDADFRMKGLIWEAKSPTSNNHKTLTVTMRRAVKQSSNVVVDLRRIRGDDMKMRNELEKLFNEMKQIKNLLVINKNGDLISYQK